MDLLTFFFYFSEFEKYSIPEDLIPLSRLALPGLARFSQTSHPCQEDLDKIDPLPNLSPADMPKRLGMKSLSESQ